MRFPKDVQVTLAEADGAQVAERHMETEYGERGEGEEKLLGAAFVGAVGRCCCRRGV